MSGLINLIKSLFSGIFGLIGGLFGGKKALASADSAPKAAKKNNGYFLEFKDSPVTSDKDGADVKPATTQAAAPEAAPMTVSVETAIAEADSKAEDAQPAKKSTRKEKLAALAAGDKPAGAKATAAEEAAVPEVPPGKAAKVVAAPEPETAAFASRYLIPTNNGGRRRPGANMSPYLDMARTMGSK